MMMCQICKKQYKSFGSLAQHITRKHFWTTQKYYDLYLKSNDKESKCICGKKTRFINIREGYVESCDNVCGGILKRKRLRENKEKFQKFTEKVSANQKKIWAKRELNGEKEKILRKAAEQNRLGIEKMSEKERYKRFCNGGKGGNVSQFIPKNPEKYKGSYPIFIRSSWERMYAQWLDLTPAIIEWSSENIHIKYYDPVQQRTRRYYPDFYMLVAEPNGKYGEYIVEIKPAKETKPPRKTGKKSKKTLRHQQATWQTNQAKFQAAGEYCEKIGMKFKIITERELFNK